MSNLKDLLAELIAIPSVSGTEQAILDHVAQQLDTYGYKVERGVGWVATYCKGTKSERALLLNGHVDTVPAGDKAMWDTDPLKLVEKDDKYYGLGVGDMKAGDAVMLKLAEDFNAQKLNYDLWFSFVAGEEVDGSGAVEFAQWFAQNTKYTSVEALVLEPTDCHDIGLGHRGNMLINIDVQGQSGHASRPKEVSSTAIDNAIAIKKKIGQLNNAWQKQYNHPFLGVPSITVTSIDSGSKNARNQFPDSCTLGVDVRLVPDMEDVESELTKALQGYKASFHHLGAIAEPFWIDQNTEFAAKLQKIEPKLQTKAFTGATDLSYLRSVITTGVIFGPGNTTTMHQYNENMTCSNLKMYYSIIESFVKSYGEDNG